MKFDDNCKKSFTVVVLILIIVGLSIPLNVTADFVISNDDGVAYDLFNNSLDIFMENCSLYDGNIALNFEPLNLTYNHKVKPNNIEAWKIENTLITPGEGSFLQLLSKLINPDLIPGYEFEPEDYRDINYKNDGEAALIYSFVRRLLNYTTHPMNLFRFTIDEEVELIDKFWISWQSGAYDKDANIEKITMYLWSHGDLRPRWSYIHSIPYNSENITYPRGSIGEELSIDKYISEEGGIDVLIVGTPLNSTSGSLPSKLWSDYIEVKIGIEEGYKSEGFVISSPIEPLSTKFKGWESIFWEGSNPSSTTNVKIQVLDQDNNPIDTLEGNLDGFSSSPIDLSSLSTDHKMIKLKALLKSESPQFTPNLYSWGVLWHTIDGFYDSFTYNFRVGESFGINIEDGRVKISSFYSEWPIFGKEPSNSRSYVGPDPENNNKTYWTTRIDKDFSGWFRSPVMSNGIVYIGSNNKRISAFNLSRDSIEKIQNPFDTSANNYTVESSVAVGDGLVIVATGELDNRSNKIYALNATNLSQVVWSRPNTDTENTICFSSSPTIANDRVFVTSWSGRFGNTPQAYYIYSWLNSLTNNALGLENHLYAFDLKTGFSIWGGPINLPAGSLSTPAIDNGIIYVGCENTQGPSLLAFEENSGKLLWNVSVGMIGRSSPVIADSENGKIVIVQSREQNIFSFSGEDKVYAIRAETGEFLWNKTLGNESSLFRSTLFRLLNFKNLVATSEPASTPAISGNTVYILAPNGTLYALNIETGEEKWTFDVSQGIDGLFTFYTTSPVVVGNTVYVCAQNGNVYAINANNGKLKIDYDIQFPGIDYMLLNFYSSPIVTDGLIVASTTELVPNLGHLICLGNYKENSIGSIHSKPIHIQSGKWWNKLNITTLNTTKENTISISILDGDGNIIREGLNGSDNDISDSNIFNTAIIQLYAEINVNNESVEDFPSLDSWKVTYINEINSPIFNADTFTPDPGGWINNNKPVCSIQVYDNFPGLDVTSAKYRLVYVDNKKSDWYDAECTGINGTKDNQTLTADVTLIQPTNDLKRIEMSIKDLSGNNAIFELSEDFKLDSEAPSSYIESTLLNQYNEPFRIEANATDTGQNRSGVKTISLNYKLLGEENWTQYGLSESPYEWNFDIAISGHYEIATIAEDRAGNIEEYPDETENNFVFDKISPLKPDILELYPFSTVPEFSIDFTDDYLLKDVEYRLSFRGEWIKINDEDINDISYKGEWKIEESDWEYMEDNEIYFIYFRITDAAGNIYQTPTDTEALALIKDMIPPGSQIELDLSDLEGGGWKDEYTITAYVPYDEDIDYVTLEYRYSPDDDKWSDWKQSGGRQNKSVYSWKFSAEEGSGYYEFRVKVWDNAGNYVESLTGKVSLTVSQTGLIILFIALFIIFIILSRFLSRKMIKKKE
ncbi:MAG: PQQ-binding-like beta-propeller repeat protein [Thermoplasmatales archaeon]|nr:MAG: PQQ-binding-like beta-propeller repeat protein [Thermoplasmatales archaeon]